MNEHLLKKFDAELTKLRFRLVRMGALVQEQIELSLRSIMENSEELASLVFELEEKVNKLDLKIDKQCLRIFALHQPVAMDLRHVLSAVTINNDLEMLGDMATVISKSNANLKFDPDLIAKTRFMDISDRINIIVADVMDAFVFLSSDRAMAVVLNYKEITEMAKENIENIIVEMKMNSAFVEQGARLIDINRSIQNIARFARSIAEELVFLIDAKMIRHTNLLARSPTDESEDGEPIERE